MKNPAIAWLASSAAFSAAFVGFMVFWTWLDDRTLRSGSAILRLGLLTISAALVVQLLYGGLVYLVLSGAGLWKFWLVVLAYLFPLFVFGWFAIDTRREAFGMIAWVVFSFIVAWVSWFFAPVQTRRTTA
ncbi:MAG TPA: hypothetical protein VFL62_03540 [Bradyrhizobium sp.]|uniref:hypothetical protein n=1 Tax=Bradyrhizobium sp. TaxID=376 RepID=UPI002D800064|nr:hypothetical protein [Bradyrhizobium sp.]HET7885280.1 hypothetical protein [Bradyrhizobium sp.]